MFNHQIKVEPYWNVKMLVLVIEEYKKLIKVEPYWNVKLDKDKKNIWYILN